ncbi:MAG: MFS transporter [Candidatus Hydrogenedentes bacterium]|nr:MFS transporter [Candidatus Hydrogenedentota bacterium]
MPFPLINDFRKLSQAPQRFLVFSTFNVFSWFSLVGPVVVLFGRTIDMPASWIGFLLSFMPLSMLLVMATIPLVTRFGPKRLMIVTWIGRNLAASLVFFIPWMLHNHGARSSWILLLTAVLSFCLVRAAGVGGWFPWLHEVVPEKEQNTFFSTETALAQFCIVVVTLSQAAILGREPGVPHFMVIYAFGIAAGLMSALWLSRVPGGRATYNPEFPQSSFISYRAAWRDRPYIRFVFTTGLCYSCLAWINASAVLYMRDALHFTDLRIMLVLSAGNLGVLSTIHFWGRFAEQNGTGHAAVLAMVGHSCAALTFLLLPPGAPWTAWLLPPVFVASCVLNLAYWTLTHKHMIQVVDEHHKVGYTNIWILGTALSLGLTPIFAGYIIEHLNLTGYRIAFSLAGFGGLVAALANYWVVFDRKPLRSALDELIDPALPVRTLARIAWVTVGLHSSNRKRDGE